MSRLSFKVILVLNKCKETCMNFSSFSLKVLAASLVLASASGFAANYKGDYKGEAPCPLPPSLMDGFYLGGQVGYDSFKVRQSSDFVTADGLSSASSSVALGSAGWMGGSFLGYGQYFSNFYYLAGEIYGNYSGVDQTNSANTLNPAFSTASSNKAEVNGTFGLSLLPGIKLNDATLGYLRLGYAWTKFKGNFASTFNGTGSGLPIATVSGSNSKTEGGWDLGVGIETLLVQNWSARLEYNHIWYSNFSSSASNAFASASTTFKP